jgi:hypothetical protein
MFLFCYNSSKTTTRKEKRVKHNEWALAFSQNTEDVTGNPNLS